MTKDYYKPSQKSLKAVRAEVSMHEPPRFCGGRKSIRPSIHQGERIFEMGSIPSVIVADAAVQKIQLPGFPRGAGMTG